MLNFNLQLFGGRGSGGGKGGGSGSGAEARPKVVRSKEPSDLSDYEMVNSTSLDSMGGKYTVSDEFYQQIMDAPDGSILLDAVNYQGSPALFRGEYEKINGQFVLTRKNPNAGPYVLGQITSPKFTINTSGVILYKRKK